MWNKCKPAHIQAKRPTVLCLAKSCARTIWPNTKLWVASLECAQVCTCSTYYETPVEANTMKPVEARNKYREKLKLHYLRKRDKLQISNSKFNLQIHVMVFYSSFLNFNDVFFAMS